MKMKKHKKLLIIVVATVLFTALLGSYLNSVDEGLSTSVTRTGKFNKGFFYKGAIEKIRFLQRPMTSVSSVERQPKKGVEEFRKLDLNEDVKKRINPQLKEIDEIIDDIGDVINIGTPDGNIVGIGTPDGNIVGIGTPDGN